MDIIYKYVASIGQYIEKRMIYDLVCNEVEYEVYGGQIRISDI